jgi:outer membrane protein assembly factor BamB
MRARSSQQPQALTMRLTMRRPIHHIFVIVLFTELFAGAPGSAQSPSWLQWGGPQRNFVVATTGLASSWPATGPRQLWTRALGEGHSSILAEDGRLYTQYRPLGMMSAIRRSQEEVVVALDAASGKTVWEHRYPATTTGLDFEYGAGPHATPLIVGPLLFATGSNKQIFALDKQTGRVVWSHDMLKEYSASPPGRGYSCSPIAYKDTVIVTVGGPGQAVVAFRQKDGTVAWKNQNFAMAPASPILITISGEDQLVVFGGNEVVGLNPNNGDTLWSHPHSTDWGLNISTPVWSPQDNLLFISSAYNTGSRLLKLTKDGPKTTARELWFTNRMRVHIGTVIRLGDHYFGSSGDFGPSFIVAVDAKTGQVAFQDRGFARSTFLYADGKLIILDEDGTLAIATASATGIKVLARANVMTKTSWTVPTLVGTRLYVRDRKNIAAFDLGG